jgi:hypothetical protein
MRTFGCGAIAAGFIAFGLTWAASASPVTFGYQGSIVSVAAFDPESPFPDTVDIGTTYTGTYTFNSAAVNGIGGLDSGAYDSPLGTFTLSLGGLFFSFGDVTIVTANVAGSKYYGVQYAENPTDLNPTGVLLQINLFALNDSALSSNALPLTPPDLTNFDTTNAFFFTDTIAGNQVELAGALDTLDCVSGCNTVPEPSSVATVSLALIALAASRATHTRQRRRMPRLAARRKFFQSWSQPGRAS